MPRQEARTVLVVDDEESIRALLGALVRRAGGDPIAVDTAARAREQVRAGDPVDLAIIDKNLPDGSGLDLLRWLRETSPRTDVMVLTGYSNVDAAASALSLGAVDYIVKPFDAPWLVRRIELALAQRQLALSLDDKDAELRRVQLECALALGRAAEMGEPLKMGGTGHSRRVSLYAGVLARELDGTPAWVESVSHAAMLHDLGNVGVPGAILSKPGPLTPEEREIMRSHVRIGAEILAGATSEVLVMGREVILTHHERWDGSGYPAGLRGEEIPLPGRLVAVIDVWDAMRTDRPYRRALDHDAAVAQLRAAAGTQLDAEIVEAFLDSAAGLTLA